jgi:hypothetical protein
VLVGLVVFIVFVLKRLVTEHGRLIKKEEVRAMKAPAAPGRSPAAWPARWCARCYWRGWRWGLDDPLPPAPAGAEHEQDELVQRHQRASRPAWPSSTSPGPATTPRSSSC